jgi:hypothetical protein
MTRFGQFACDPARQTGVDDELHFVVSMRTSTRSRATT